MSPENKQRVIGIVILVAFVALLIPFLFTSGIGRKVLKSDQIPMSPEQRQLAALQIKNTGSVVASPKQSEASTAANQAQIVPGSLNGSDQQSSEIATPPSPQASTVVNEQPVDVSFPPELSSNNRVSPPSLPTLESDAELTNKTNAVVAPEAILPEEEPKEQKKIDEVLLMDKIVKKSIDIKTKTKAPKKAKTAPRANKKNNITTKKASIKKAGNWSVQVGSFTNPTSVNKLVSQLRGKGFKAYLQKVTKNNITMTRVLVGSEANKQIAKQIADKLSADLNITGHLTRS